MAKTLPRRDEVPEADKWAVESLFPSEEAFNAAFVAADAAIGGLAPFQGTLGQSGAQLLAGLEAADKTAVAVSWVGVYASMQFAGDTTNPANMARFDRAQGLYARLGAATAFYRPELLALAPETIEACITAEPGLALYRHYFDKLNLVRLHVRSLEVETVLAQVSDLADSAERIHDALENAEMAFPTVKDEQSEDVALAQGNVWPLIQSADRAVRKAAWEGYADGYLAVRNTFAAALSSAVKRDVFYAQARRYTTAREAALFPHHIPLAVFDNLIATVRANLPLWHRYWEVRRRALGVETLQPYDVHVPLATAAEAIPYDKAVEMLRAGLAPLGEEYVSIATRGLTVERWVDRYPNLGKGSGAFSTGAYGSRPFLMQNYENDLLSLSTLAHELGHSMHTYYTCANQPPIYARYSMFVAETASNFNQALLRAYLLSSSDDRRFKIAVIEEGMSNFLRYFFIMPILAQFALDAHTRIEQGDAITADTMSAKIAELYGEGFGDRVAMDAPRVGITWAQFPHMYGNYYVFQYATGISAANALADGVLHEGAPAAQRYISFLKAGDSLYPIDALKLAGIDMTTPAPVERAFGVLGGLIDELDRLVGDGPLPWLGNGDQGR